MYATVHVPAYDWQFNLVVYGLPPAARNVR